MSDIISFSGRKESGKTLLASICVQEYGYTMVNFADPIKDVTAQVFGITRDTLERLKDASFSQPVNLTNNQIYIIHDMTGIQTSYINNHFEKVSIQSFRHFLQVLGTDVIRKYNQDWHIEEIRKRLVKNGNKLVFADARFKNELNFLKELGAETWFISRLHGYKSISQHASETSLDIHDFGENVLFNIGIDLDSFIQPWRQYMSGGPSPVKKMMCDCGSNCDTKNLGLMFKQSKIYVVFFNNDFLFKIENPRVWYRFQKLYGNKDCIVESMKRIGLGLSRNF